MILQMRERITDLQAELAVQMAVNKELKEDQVAKLKENQYLTKTNEFQKKKCTLYQKMVRDANEKCGFELPADTEKRRLMNWIEN